jgi:hypothetical protein
MLNVHILIQLTTQSYTSLQIQISNLLNSTCSALNAEKLFSYCFVKYRLSLNAEIFKKYNLQNSDLNYIPAYITVFSVAFQYEISSKSVIDICR